MRFRYAWLSVLMVLALLLAACGPQMATPQPGEEATPAAASPGEASPTEPQTEAPTARPTAVPTEGGPAAESGDGWRVKGSADAPVTIIEYSDFQCPYCARYVSETLSKIEEEYIATGQVRYIYRHFPLGFHDQARPAAQASECAGEQGKFWEMHDALFENQADWSGSPQAPTVFADLAEELGLDRAEFEACLSSDKYAGKVDDDYEAGVADGVSGTPGFLINGLALSGAQPFSAFQEQIEFFLAGGQPPTTEVAADSYRSMGRADAPVVITEFSDYACPACASFETQVMPELIERYVDTGQARLVFREFPIPSLHPNATKAAQAAVCAGEQEKYWEMHDALYASRDEWMGVEEPGDSLSALAAEVGLDQEAFAQCLDSQEAAAAVRAERMAGEMMGVNATPFFFINDLPIRGGLSVDSFAQIIEYVAAGGERPGIVPQGNAPTVIGNQQTASAATVAFVDYGSVESAQHALEVLPKLRESYIDTGKLIYILHPWYAESGSPSAQAALVAECAGQQGSYWQMHDQLFEEQEEWLSADDPKSLMTGYAQAMGLDVSELETCLASDEVALQVTASKVVAALYRVPAGPFFLFNNGQAQEGSPSFEEFQVIIDSMLGPQE